MRKLFTSVVLTASLFAFQGCAPSCDDVCDHIASCSEKFGVTTSESEVKECVSSCEGGMCGSGASEEKSQAAMECIVGVECGNNALDLGGRVISCLLTNCR